MQKLKQRADGRYRCKYRDKEFYGATQAEALRARDEYIALLKSGLKPDSGKMTVRKYSARWLPTHKANIARPTYNDYAHYFDLINNIIGDMPISSVTPTDVKAVYNTFTGKSNSFIQKVEILMKSMFRFAVLDGYIRVNPCDSVEPEKGYSGTHRAITDEERKWILETQSDLRLAVLVMLYAGLRRGEVLALSMDSVDLDANLIYVTEAVAFDRNQRIIKAPKTAAGVRAVPIVGVLREELEGHTGLITGKELTRCGFYNAWDRYVNAVELHANGCSKRWYGISKEAQKKDPERYARYTSLKKEEERLRRLGKVEEADRKRAEAEAVRLTGWKPFTVRPHDLRHSYVQMLCDAKVEIDLAMKWVGHRSEKMIRGIYDHVSDYRSEKAMIDVERVISERWES